MRHLITTTLFFLLFSPAQAQENSCIDAKDFEEVAQHFRQYNRYLSNQDQYCQDDMGSQWFDVAQSLVLLKNAIPDEPEIDINDALTYRAIEEKDWWSYFTKRARSFRIDRNCPEGVVAYVYPGFDRGNIHICEIFFDLPTFSQASIMMHEVRHFDGHGHVTCSQGSEQGTRGACDRRITSKGSYAISVQTLVALARAKETPPTQRASLEAEAIYMAFNRFNQIPQVKLEDAVVLSNSLGDIYRWVIGQGVQFVKTLANPAALLASGTNLTIYPLDASQDAYRMDPSLNTRLENPGLYAKSYNNESISEREKYQSISYLGTGGLLKNNTLITLCNSQSVEFGRDNLDRRGQFTRILNLPKNGPDREYDSYLLEENGSLLSYECAGTNSSRVRFNNTRLKVSTGAATLQHAFALSGQAYALSQDGELMNLEVINKTLTTSSLTLPIDNKDWISAAPLSRAQVF